MTVARVLEQKGRTVATIAAEATLSDAAATLAKRKIGALVITDPSGAIAGILSERDVVRAVGQEGAGALANRVAQHMTTKVVTCMDSHRVLDVMEMMTAGRFRHVPVVRDGRLDGIISIGDVVKHRLSELESEQQALREYITQGV
jgi:CBS domain-containing protein